MITGKKINEIINEKNNIKWRKLPLSQSVKDLIIGRTCFSKEEIELLNQKEGYYTAISKRTTSPLDQVNDELSLIIINKEGKSYLYKIK